MGQFWKIIGVLMLIPGLGYAQGQEVRAKRVLNEQDPVYQSHSFKQVQTLRIENGSLWINGNLVPKADLPESLQEIRQDYRMETSLFGINEFQFTLLGRDYLLKHGKIVEIQVPGSSNLASNSPNSKQQYFTNLKNEQPDLFSRQVREAELYQQITLLLLDYQIANELQQAGISKEIRAALSQMFDLNMQNEEEEIRQLEYQLNLVKKELEFRRKNKELILDNRMKEILGK